MFGGLGGEVLWSPFRKRWSVGLNVNWVKQRDFSKDFSYQKLFDGHGPRISVLRISLVRFRFWIPRWSLPCRRSRVYL